MADGRCVRKLQSLALDYLLGLQGDEAKRVLKEFEQQSELRKARQELEEATQQCNKARQDLEEQRCNKARQDLEEQRCNKERQERLEEEAKQQRYASCLMGTSIVMEGLPEMHNVPFVSCSSSGEPASGNQPTARIEERPFLPQIQILAEAIEEGINGDLHHLCRDYDLIKASMIWLCSAQRPLQYCTEADIRYYVKQTLLDAAAVIQKPLGAARSLRASTAALEVASKKSDLIVLFSHFKPVGVVKVRTPGKGAMMSDDSVLGELYDDMMTLRCFQGLKHVYGIVTTYNEWRICWLEDTDGDAQSTDMPDMPDLPAADASGERRPPFEGVPLWPKCADGLTDISVEAVHGLTDDVMTQLTWTRAAAGLAAEPERSLFATRVIERSDKSLVTVLTSVLTKMASSPSNPAGKFVEADRNYPTYSDDQWRWKMLTATSGGFDRWVAADVLSYALLAPLGQGSSGRAYLTLADSAICVLKRFLRPTTAESRQEELDLWRKVWDAHFVKEVSLAGEYVLVLPYIKTCQGTVEDQSEYIKEATRAAVGHMAERGFQHLDLCWRHVGLCYKLGEGLCAVLIDLESTQALQTEDEKAEACKAMLTALGLAPEA